MSRLMQLRLVAVLSLGAVQLGCNGETIEAPQPGATIYLEAASPTTLTGTVASEVTPAPTVLVTDQYHNPLPGIEVFWTSAESGAMVTASTRTRANGTATVETWRLGTSAGIQTLRAVTAAEPLTSVLFTAVASPAAAATITAVDSAQTALAGTVIALRVRVADAFNNPIAAASVTFEIESGGGNIASAAVSTDSVGIARTEWRVGAVGLNSVTASMLGLERVRFTTVAFEALSYYELELMPEFISPPSAWIALRENSQFITSVNGLDGSGEYTTSGDGITFNYADAFLSTLGATMDWWAYPYSLKQEFATITPDVIVIRRCLSEDCYERDWTYRRKRP